MTNQIFKKFLLKKSLHTHTLEKAANKYSDLKEHCKILKQQMKLIKDEQLKLIELFTKIFLQMKRFPKKQQVTKSINRN